MALNFRKMLTSGKRKKGDRVMRKTLPINLQFFAEGGDGNGDQNAGNNNNGQAGQQGGQNNQQAAGIDYDKIQSMLDTATAKKENAVLKSYFQQQGLSEEEVSQAIATFKQNKQQQVEQQQNANANLQNEVTTAQKDAEQARIELAATQVAMTLGINAKTVQYVLTITAKGIYASHSWLNDYMNVDELIEHGALIWEAHWNDDGEICEDKFAMSQESSDYYLNDGTRVDYDIMYDEVYDRLTKANEYDHRNDGVEDNDNADEDNNAGADDTEQLQHEIGEYVEYNAIYAASTSEAALTPSAGFNSGRITRVIPWASNPYLIDDGTGWVNDGCIVSAGDSSDGESNEESETDISDIKAGDKVRVLLNVDYDTDRAFNLYYDEYDVIQVDGDRAVIGIDNTVTSAIDVHHLERI